MINFIYCAWAFIANDTLLNIEWPDGNSQYYGTLINTTKIKLNGNFPNSRYFSYQLYSFSPSHMFDLSKLIKMHVLSAKFEK